ncbi:MAG: hypothetical protein E7272_07820 [Pseudobutyrivibrio ruminis]|uniref:Uncharacterized protein n=1 Tax=Pseudobutyrivibrio ruminis TaxID=46206 RepID=A0A927YME7_9FIRM|nr:hypothetical protein [Pseudobutyrivibrio ruminis]
MKQKIICILLLTSLASTFSGMKYIHAEEIEQEDANTVEETPVVNYQSEMGETGDYYVLNCPNYYQQDYKDIAFGDSTIGEQGNLITCLASLETYYLTKDVNPETFVGIHSDDCLHGTKTINKSSIDRYAKYFGTALDVQGYDFDVMANYVKRYSAKVLIRIPHESALGKKSTYFLVTGITKDGFIVVDPNKDNLKYAHQTNEGYIYDSLFISIVCGKSAEMYIFH